MKKTGKGGRREGSGRRKKPDGEKKIQWWVYLREDEIEKFGAAGGTREQVANWVRAYPMVRSETDRLLDQPPTTVKLMAHLEATNEPQELIDELKSLMTKKFDL